MPTVKPEDSPRFQITLMHIYRNEFDSCMERLKQPGITDERAQQLRKSAEHYRDKIAEKHARYQQLTGESA